MKVKSNVIIFSTDNEERKDVRRLKEKKLQIVLDEKNRQIELELYPDFSVVHNVGAF